MADWTYTVNTSMVGGRGPSVFTTASFVNIITCAYSNTITFSGSMPCFVLGTPGTLNTSPIGSIVPTTSNYGYRSVQTIVSDPYIGKEPPTPEQFTYTAGQAPSFRWLTLPSVSDPLLQFGTGMTQQIGTGVTSMNGIDILYSKTPSFYMETSSGPNVVFSTVTTQGNFVYWNVSTYIQTVTPPSFSLTLSKFSSLQEVSTLVNLTFSTCGTIQTQPTYSNVAQGISPYYYTTSTIFADTFVSTQTTVQGSFKLYGLDTATTTTVLKGLLETTDSTLILTSTFTLPEITPIPIVANLCFMTNTVNAYEFYNIKTQPLNTNTAWVSYKRPSRFSSRVILNSNISSALFFYDGDEFSFCAQNKTLDYKSLIHDFTFVNTQTSARLLQLPSAVANTGRVLSVKDVSNNSTANPIFIYEKGNTMDGDTAPYRILQGSNNPSITFVSNGFQWYVHQAYSV